MTKKINKCLFIIFSLFVITACTNKNKSTATVQVDSKDKQFVWWKDRDHVFGEYNYSTTDESEAKEDLKNIFQVETLPFFDKGRKLVREALLIENVTEQPEVYKFNSDKNTLQYLSVIGFKNTEGKYLSYGTVTENYEFIKDLNKVKISSQRIELVNSTKYKQYNGKDLEETLRQLANLLELEDIDELMQRFEQQTKDKENLSKKSIIIYDSADKAKANKTFGKTLLVEYNEEGILASISAITADFRE
ncbi:hypothetical protein ACYSNW_11155 [Enterococcus sp. LJL99]